MSRIVLSEREHSADDILTASGDEIVCYCAGVTKNQIAEAVQAGARTLAAIKDATGACTIARCHEMHPRGR